MTFSANNYCSVERTFSRYVTEETMKQYAAQSPFNRNSSPCSSGSSKGSGPSHSQDYVDIKKNSLFSRSSREHSSSGISSSSKSNLQGRATTSTNSIKTKNCSIL